MAYMSQENKKKIQAKMTPLLKEYGVKATLSVANHSTINLNIKSSAIDFLGNYNEQADRYNYRTRQDHLQLHPSYLHDSSQPWFTGKALEFLQKAMAILQDGNFDHSDSQSDYFHVGWYSYINIGSWDKPYIVTNA